jgi:hypothetical protein
MAEPVLTKTRLRAGVWEGVLKGEGGLPALEVLHLEQVLPGIAVTPMPDQPGAWLVRVPIPAEALSDGVQTFVIRKAGQDERLAHFTIVTGMPLEDDLRAEIDLLRAELDLLKRAFRRHCVETAN